MRRPGEPTRKPRWSRVSLEHLERRDLLSATPSGALLFQFTPGGAGGAAALIQAAEADRLSLTATDIPGLYRASGDQQALARLGAQFAGADGVGHVEAEGVVQVALTPDDPAFKDGTLYGLNGTFGVKAPAAWDLATGSLSVVVADIDTGVDYTHRDLYKNIWLNQGEIPASLRPNLIDTDGDGLITFWDLNEAANAGKVADGNGNGYIDAGDALRAVASGGLADGNDNDGNGKVDDLIGWDYVNNDNDPMDDHNHGTHTAGTIAGIGNNATGVAGVSWRAQIMVMKFLGSNGSGSTTNAASAVRYAADKGAQISNNSWGGGGFSATMFNAIAYADGKNHLFVAAAGNDGANTDSAPNYPSAYSTYNGVTLNNILAVAATGSTGALASFSNFGATSVDLAAPGVGIYSTVRGGSYASFSGTSMATPHAAGVAALLLAREPGLTDAQVIARLTSTVTTVSGLSGKVASGGIVNAAAALEAGVGAYVTAVTPTGTVNGSVDRVQLTFSKEVKAGTFTLADVVELAGPTGPISATGVNRLSATVYEVTFAPQGASGTYRLTVGPDIQNLAGVQMDQDRDGRAGEATDDRYTATFAIQSPGPTANAGLDRTSDEGATVNFSGQATGDGLSYLWDFGDGQTASGTLAPSHAYADDGSYTVTLTVTDSLSRQASDTAVVTVANVRPTATLGNSGPVTAGSPVTVSFAAVSDPSPADTDAGFRYSYDFDNDGLFEVADSASASAGHTFAGAGAYTVRGRVADKDGGFSDYTTAVTVNAPAAPSAPTKFDLGTATSPVASGYTRVTEATAYSAAQGYGWTAAPVGTVDRGASAGDGLQRDLAYGKGAAVFAVDVPNGTYTVGLVLGELYSYDQIAVDLEGQRVGVLTTKGGQWLTPSYTVTVSDGQLTLQIQDLGGSDPWWVLNAITVTPDSGSSGTFSTGSASSGEQGQGTGVGLKTAATRADHSRTLPAVDALFASLPTPAGASPAGASVSAPRGPVPEGLLSLTDASRAAFIDEVFRALRRRDERGS